MTTTKKRKEKVKRKSSGKSDVYFTEDTEKAIIKFVNSGDRRERDEIYAKEIRPALNKLVENIIFVFNFHVLDDVAVLKNDCVSFLFEVLTKFDPTRGKRAFSYLSVVAKNWFIQKQKQKKKKSSNDIHFDRNVLNYLEKNNNENVVFSYEDTIYKKEFLDILKKESLKWREKFHKEQEKKVLEAVILLLTNPSIISIYNKKGVFLYLKEITGLTTKQIVTNLDKFRKKYEMLKRRYDNGEF